MSGQESRRLMLRKRSDETVVSAEGSSDGDLYAIIADALLVAREFAANQTDTELVAAPGAGYQLVVYDIVISTAEAVTVLIEEGNAVRRFGRLTLAANADFVFNSAAGVRFAANTSITVTTTGMAAGPLSITVNYAVKAV